VIDSAPQRCRQSRLTSRVIHQGGAEDVLADALDDEPLDLGRLRQAGGLRANRASGASGRLMPSL
jgi:hypothetical protein